MDVRGPLFWIILLLTLDLTCLGPATLVHTENRRDCSAFSRRHLMGALQELDLRNLEWWERLHNTEELFKQNISLDSRGRGSKLESRAG